VSSPEKHVAISPYASSATGLLETTTLTTLRQTQVKTKLACWYLKQVAKNLIIILIFFFQESVSLPEKHAAIPSHASSGTGLPATTPLTPQHQTQVGTKLACPVNFFYIP